MRDRVARLFRGIRSERAEGREPVPVVPPRGEGEHDSERDREAGQADAAAVRARFEQVQGQEEERNPLHEHRERPRGPRRTWAAEDTEGECAHDQHRQPGIVVAAAGEVQRKQRVPARERAGEGPPASKQRCQ